MDVHRLTWITFVGVEEKSNRFEAKNDWHGVKFNDMWRLCVKLASSARRTWAARYQKRSNRKTTKLQRGLTIKRRACYAVAKMHTPVLAGPEPVDESHCADVQGRLVQRRRRGARFCTDSCRIPLHGFGFRRSCFTPLEKIAMQITYLQRQHQTGTNCARTESKRHPFALSHVSAGAFMPFQFKKLFTKAACAAAFVLGAMAPAQAAVIVGSFDPDFSNDPLTFTNLSWRGEVRINIADSCLALQAGTFTRSECSNAAIFSAFVELYDTDNPVFGTFDRLEFGAGGGASGALELAGFTSSLGKLSTLDLRMKKEPGGWVAPQGTLGAPVDPGYKNYLYGLSLQSTEANLQASSKTIENGIDPTFGCPYGGFFAICASDNKVRVTFVTDPPPNVVPEPQGLLLFAGALVGAALASRRRRPV